MILYAIQHVPTALFLPRKESRGTTHAEPTATLDKARLFTRDSDARGFLTVWLRGKQTQVTGPSNHESFYDDDAWIEVEKVPSRKRHEMQIVAYVLSYAGVVE